MFDVVHTPRGRKKVVEPSHRIRGCSSRRCWGPMPTGRRINTWYHGGTTSLGNCRCSNDKRLSVSSSLHYHLHIVLSRMRMNLQEDNMNSSSSLLSLQRELHLLLVQDLSEAPHKAIEIGLVSDDGVSANGTTVDAIHVAHAHQSILESNQSTRRKRGFSRPQALRSQNQSPFG